MEKQRVIAVDFDGCLCDNAYPDIGAPNWQVIDAALKERADGAALILWTCREGDMLQQALDACKGWKCVGQAGGLRWTGKRRPEVDLCPAQMKLRWEIGEEAAK